MSACKLMHGRVSVCVHACLPLYVNVCVCVSLHACGYVLSVCACVIVHIFASMCVYVYVHTLEWCVYAYVCVAESMQKHMYRLHLCGHAHESICACVLVSGTRDRGP